VIGSPYAERLKADGKRMVTIFCRRHESSLAASSMGLRLENHCSQLHSATNTFVRLSHNPQTTVRPVLCFVAGFNCAQFSSSTADRLILMAVIWIDEFEDGRMESPIGTTLYEHRQIEPTEHALKPGVPYIAQFRFGPVNCHLEFNPKQVRSNACCSGVTWFRSLDVIGRCSHPVGYYTSQVI